MIQKQISKIFAELKMLYRSQGQGNTKKILQTPKYPALRACYRFHFSILKAMMAAGNFSNDVVTLKKIRNIRIESLC